MFIIETDSIRLRYTRNNRNDEPISKNETKQERNLANKSQSQQLADVMNMMKIVCVKSSLHDVSVCACLNCYYASLMVVYVCFVYFVVMVMCIVHCSNVMSP